jgi:NADPH:quinone reductase-like Zn-dependent oxidoreductase
MHPEMTGRPFEPTLVELVQSIRPGGDINLYGALDPNPTPLPIFALMHTGAKISSYMVYELLIDPTRLAAAVAFFLPLFENGAIAPLADASTFSFEDIGEAFGHMASNTQFGKVVVTL